ncbi:hypothetical protein [Flavobacterium sp. W20_MBD1_R3]|uniref:hypothetical protein n=1 Tax=Flavobacterium sp. W20_MBD1_R3 TaxID=3240278 RepID=UPI003F9194B8
MKKLIFSAAITTFIAATIMVGCQNTTKDEAAAQENVEDARDNLDDAKEELSSAREAATKEEWQAFKDSTNATISQNEMRIAEMKAKMKKTGKTIDEGYAQKIEELEQKNKEIKLKVDQYKNDAGDDWKSFKEEYNRDIDELGTAIKNLTVDNK